MKAIQVRHLAPTTHKGHRIKAWAFGWPSMTWAVEYDNPITVQERMLAVSLLMENLHEDDRIPRLHRGVLPNGDSVFTLDYN